jgi:hypothetical protein
MSMEGQFYRWQSFPDEWSVIIATGTLAFPEQTHLENPR